MVDLTKMALQIKKKKNQKQKNQKVPSQFSFNLLLIIIFINDGVSSKPNHFRYNNISISLRSLMNLLMKISNLNSQIKRSL